MPQLVRFSVVYVIIIIIMDITCWDNHFGFDQEH